MNKPQKINLEQGNEEWKSWRRLHLCGTDSAALLGLSPWKTSFQLFEEKIFGKEQEENEIMRRGKELEPLARKIICDKFQQDFKPACYESGEHTFMGCSLDCINEGATEGHEIKTTGLKTLENVRNGIIPEAYVIQCQKTMLVMDWEGMHLDFFVFSQNNELIDAEYILITRDEKLQDKIVTAETNFWFKNILPEKPPALTHKDLVLNDNDFENQLANKLKDLKEELNEAEKNYKTVEKQLKELAEGKSVYFRHAGVKLVQVNRKGNVDWKSVQKEWKISEEELKRFRKENSSYVKITFEV